MDPERWRQIYAVYQAARDRSAEDRAMLLSGCTWPRARRRYGSARDFAIHSRLVDFKKRHLVPGDQKLRNFHFAVRGSLQDTRGFSKPVHLKIVCGKHVRTCQCHRRCSAW